MTQTPSSDSTDRVIEALADVPHVEPGSLNRPLLRVLGNGGLLDVALGRPGADGSYPLLRHLCDVRERLARVRPEAETAFAVQGLGGRPITSALSPAAGRWAEPLASGQAAAGFALSEPEGGSDVARMRTRAAKDGDSYRLDGVKCWISNVPHADVYTVFARTSDEGARGLTAFVVPADSPGLTGSSIKMLGSHPLGRLEFSGVPVPRSHVIGEPGQGFEIAMKTLDVFRPSVGAFAVGMAQAALDLAVEHTATRVAFGGPLSRKQGVTHQLAECATQIAAARALVRQAADIADETGTADPMASAMAKLFATEMAQRVIDVAIQVHGALALTDAHPLSHLYREVRATRIYEGASEIQREIIGRALYVGMKGRSS